MFENISKGEFSVAKSGDNGVIGRSCPTAGVESDEYMIVSIWADVPELEATAKPNAEFIAFCFNLQQKYDIGLLEETIHFIDQLAGSHKLNFNDYARAKELLGKLKQNK